MWCRPFERDWAFFDLAVIDVSVPQVLVGLGWMAHGGEPLWVVSVLDNVTNSLLIRVVGFLHLFQVLYILDDVLLLDQRLRNLLDVLIDKLT